MHKCRIHKIVQFKRCVFWDNRYSDTAVNVATNGDSADSGYENVARQKKFHYPGDNCKMSKNVILLTGLWAALVCCGCSEGAKDTIDIEEPIIPCGGDVVGNWNMTEAYIPGIEEMLAAEAPACQGALTDQATSVQGTMTFTVNGTSNINGSLSQSVSMVLTADCIKDFLKVDTLEVNQALCVSLASLLSGTAQSPFDAAACDHISGTCNCDAQKNTAIVSNGSYSLPGNNTIVDQDGVASPYCVSDNSLLIETTGDEGAVVNLLLTP